MSNGCASLDLSSVVIHVLSTKLKINNQIDAGTPIRRKLDKWHITEKILDVFTHTLTDNPSIGTETV